MKEAHRNLLDMITVQQRAWIAFGVAEAAAAASPFPQHLFGSRTVRVRLQPSGQPVEARVAAVGGGLGHGIFTPVAAGDEVLLLFPDGNSGDAIILGSLSSAANPNPLANDGTKILLLHSGGVELRSVDGIPAERLVLEPLLSRLLPILQALLTFMGATATDTFATPTVGPAAVAFNAAALADLTALVVELTTSLAGAGPLSSPSHKATL